MSLAEQIKVLRRIEADLKKELNHLEDGPAKVDLAFKVETLGWTILTLEKLRQHLESERWLREAV